MNPKNWITLRKQKKQMRTNYKEMLNSLTESEKRDVNDRVLIVDGLNMFIRVFGAVPTLNDDGEHVGGITGFLLSLGARIRAYNPTRVLMVFDGKGGSAKRKKIFPDYKAGRSGITKLNRLAGYEDLEDQDKSMKHQFATVVEYLQMLPLDVCYIDYIEADDVIAYAANHIFKKEVNIVSSDRDFLQLIDDRISVWAPTKKKMYNEQVLLDEYGISAKNFLLYRMIEGDTSDKIPGVSGIGKKTLLKHFPEFGTNTQMTVDIMVDRINSMEKKPKALQTFVNSTEQLDLNFRLMQLANPDLGSAIASNIRGIVDSPINTLNTFLFKKQFMVDKLYTAFKNIEAWIGTTWTELDTYAKTNRR